MSNAEVGHEKVRESVHITVGNDHEEDDRVGQYAHDDETEEDRCEDGVETRDRAAVGD